MDRLDSCVKFLNANDDYPKSEEDFVIFVMFSCKVVDAVKKLLAEIGASCSFDDKSNPNRCSFFQETCIAWQNEDDKLSEFFVKGNALNLTEEDCPTDDKFFEYFRSLSFAHPFETNRAKFLKENETQYCPWVIVTSGDSVGLRIYSSAIPDGMLRLTFQFSTLKGYIKSRYELMPLATNWAKNVVSEKEKVWKERKVDRTLDTAGILKDIKDILESRHSDDWIHDIEDLVTYVECESTLASNYAIVQRFKAVIREFLPELIDSVDSLDYGISRVSEKQGKNMA